MRCKLFAAVALLVFNSASNAQPIEEYPSLALSASFTRDFHIEQLVAGASIAGRFDDATSTLPSVRRILMVGAEWRAGMQADRFRITLMGVPIDPSHRLNATGDGGSNWGWWVLGGAGVVAIAAVAIGGGGGSENHSAPANCPNSTNIGPFTSVQNCQ